MRYKRQIKKIDALKKKDAPVQMDKRTKRSIFNFTVNIVFFCILYIISDSSVASVIILGGYEMLLAIMVWNRLKGCKSQITQYLSGWNLLVIVSAGILFRLKYEFFEVPESMFAMSSDEIKALLIAVIIAICMTIVIDKIDRPRLEIWMKFILVCGLSFSLVGQVLLFNDLIPKEKYSDMDYHVSEKQIDDRVFKSYSVLLESDQNHGFVVPVDKQKFGEININDKYPVIVYKGILGIEYVKKKGII